MLMPNDSNHFLGYACLLAAYTRRLHFVDYDLHISSWSSRVRDLGTCADAFNHFYPRKLTWRCKLHRFMFKLPPYAVHAMTSHPPPRKLRIPVLLLPQALILRQSLRSIVNTGFALIRIAEYSASLLDRATNHLIFQHHSLNSPLVNPLNAKRVPHPVTVVCPSQDDEFNLKGCLEAVVSSGTAPSTHRQPLSYGFGQIGPDCSHALCGRLDQLIYIPLPDEPSRVGLHSPRKPQECLATLLPYAAVAVLVDLWAHTDNGTAVRNVTVKGVPAHGVVALLLRDAGDEPEGTQPPCAQPDWCIDKNGTLIEPRNEL
ncbi:hypothetical protein ONZ45_g14178 [Pleurotus djamor]|nr:hypothetical protein ONZ45_g14178 [Pleurotus djamor]